MAVRAGPDPVVIVMNQGFKILKQGPGACEVEVEVELGSLGGPGTPQGPLDPSLTNAKAEREWKG